MHSITWGWKVSFLRGICPQLGCPYRAVSHPKDKKFANKNHVSRADKPTLNKTARVMQPVVVKMKTHIFIVTADHLSEGDLLTVTVEGFVGVQWLAAQVRHREVGGVWEIHRRLLGYPGNTMATVNNSGNRKNACASQRNRHTSKLLYVHTTRSISTTKYIFHQCCSFVCSCFLTFYKISYYY